MSSIPPNQSQQLTKTERIERAVDKQTTEGLSISAGGHLDFANLNQIMEVAKVMATSRCAIPGHLRDNPGACLAVAIQASEWQMSPFAVANKSYVVNDRMAYEAQILNAVILMRAPIKDAFIDYTYSGEGQTRICTCVCTLKSGREVKHSSPEIGKIKVKNSPLWQSDPDQQLGYYTVRAMARRYFPHVILGVYTPEEMAQETVQRDVTPSFTSEPQGATLPEGEKTTKVVIEKPVVIAKCDGNHGGPQCEDPNCWHAAAETSSAASPEASTSGPAAGAGGGGGSDDDTDRQTMLADLKKRMDKDGVSVKTVKSFAVKNNLVAAESIQTKDYSVEALQALDERWEEVTGGN